MDFPGICELEGHVKSLEEELQQRQLAHMSESARLRQVATAQFEIAFFEWFKEDICHYCLGNV